MKTPVKALLLAAILASPPAFAQLVQNDIGTHSMVFKYNDVAKIGQNKVSKDYSDVRGRYLWSNDWHRALVIMKPGNNFRMRAVKLNFYTNEIHYPENGEEMAAEIDKVKRVVLYSNDPSDTTTIIATFDVFPNLVTRKESFYQVLNEGRIQLLKRVNVAANKMGVDPIQNKETYYFYSTFDYFIRNDKILKPLKSLSKANVLEVVPEASSSKEWLSSRRNKLKREKDVADFLTYLGYLTQTHP